LHHIPRDFNPQPVNHSLTIDQSFTRKTYALGIPALL
jgi:hypothetical protein